MTVYYANKAVQQLDLSDLSLSSLQTSVVVLSGFVVEGVKDQRDGAMRQIPETLFNLNHWGTLKLLNPPKVPQCSNQFEFF